MCCELGGATRCGDGSRCSKWWGKHFIWKPQKCDWELNRITEGCLWRASRGGNGEFFLGLPSIVYGESKTLDWAEAGILPRQMHREVSGVGQALKMVRAWEVGAVMLKDRPEGVSGCSRSGGWGGSERMFTWIVDGKVFSGDEVVEAVARWGTTVWGQVKVRSRLRAVLSLSKWCHPAVWWRLDFSLETVLEGIL